jgi:cold shock CspA family protein
VIQALKDGFGFIHLAERPVDVYFRLFELMPDAVQSDIRKNMGVADTVNGAPIKYQVGTEVQFDLSLQGMGPRNRNRKGQRIQQEKENVKAQRIVLLPPGTICETKVIAQGAKGIVAKEDPKQAYAGLIDLETEWAPMTYEERHSLVSKLIKSFLASNENNGPKSIVFPDILAAKDDEVVAKLVEFYGKGSLKITHIPVSSEPDKAGRICIMKVDDGKEIHPAYNEEKSHVDCVKTDLEETEGKSEDDARLSTTKKKGKKLLEVERPIKLIRFDKHSLVEDLRRDAPPSVGDLVACDIIQSRRTGVVYLANVNITERSQVQPAHVVPSDSAIGIVTEVVAARQFGFISVHNENSTKREVLYFHTKSVLTEPPLGLSAEGSSASRSKSPTRPPSINKGDEVEFDITVGENGKKSAINVRIAPKGSLMIPVKAAKNACFGIVLMEPSYTSLKNTPNRKGGKSPASKSLMRGAGASRWENVDLEEKEVAGTDLKEDGFILLTKDPSNIFAVQSRSELSDVKSLSTHPVITAEEAEKLRAENEVVHLHATSALCSSLPYKNGAVAIYGNGASSGADGTGGPRRGDLVSFVKANSGNGVRDVRVVTKAAATMQRGRLENIVISRAVDAWSVGTAKFIAATDREEEYIVDLKEVISCDPSLLKEHESVEGIIHEGQIFGICRTCDLYLESKLGLGHKERPKLNLTVRKGLGGTIMAQSGMARGPDGTNGFGNGWTTRVSQYKEGFPVESNLLLL